MCYHISFEVKLESITDLFPDLIINDNLEIEFPTALYVDGFSHGMRPVMLTSRKDGKRHLAKMMWGYLPNHVKNMAEAQRFWNGYKSENGKWNTGYVTLNAIGEELLEKPMYKDAALNRRCIVFTDGFYEWRHIFPKNKRTGEPLKTAVKYPYHIHFKDNKEPLMMAGIWNPWKHTEVDEQTGEILDLVTPTFAICTAPATPLMAQVHNSKMRMPTILTKELALEWISEGLSDQRIKELASYQSKDSFDAYSIAKDFQKIASPKEAFEYEELTPVLCD